MSVTSLEKLANVINSAGNLSPMMKERNEFIAKIFIKKFKCKPRFYITINITAKKVIGIM